jgi:hypothetical protein
MTVKITKRQGNDGSIARAERRARELGEEGLALAMREAEEIILSLDYRPGLAERRCIEHVTILDVRVRALRSWNAHKEADKATLLLMTALRELRALSRGRLPSAAIDRPSNRAGSQ